MIQRLLYFVLLLSAFARPIPAISEELLLGAQAPLFSLQNQDGESFKIESRRGKGWTVLFFYPKAGTPGCTKQVCAFRDAIEKIRERNAEVYGISADTVEAQKEFHREHALRFNVLADPEMHAIKLYGANIPIIGMAKRWTFIIDPELKVRAIEKDVDPMLDAARVVQLLESLQKN